MPHTGPERFGSAAAYGFALLAAVVSQIYLVGAEFRPTTLLLLGAPLVVAVLLHLRGSRFALAHAINALLLYGLAFVLATLPVWLYKLQDHGILMPYRAKAWGGWVDPVAYLLIAACVFLGMPLLFVTFEALFAALHGTFLEHWPPLDWLRDWLMPRGGRRAAPRSRGKAAS